MAKTATPESRARELLRSSLTPQQLHELDMYEWFSVLGSEGGRYVILTQRRSGNVVKLAYWSSWLRVFNKKPHGMRYCAIPTNGYELPSADLWLAQKHALETDERQFLSVGVKCGLI